AAAVGDRDALWIVLVNLLRNAIRHSGGTRVIVDWRDGALGVADDGRGFDVGQGPATRLHDAAGEDGNGLGLGLSIVERICEAARGPRVRVEIPSRPIESGATL